MKIWDLVFGVEESKPKELQFDDLEVGELFRFKDDKSDVVRVKTKVQLRGPYDPIVGVGTTSHSYAGFMILRGHGSSPGWTVAAKKISQTVERVNIDRFVNVVNYQDGGRRGILTA